MKAVPSGGSEVGKMGRIKQQKTPPRRPGFEKGVESKGLR